VLSGLLKERKKERKKERDYAMRRGFRREET
jgi:hypothetical protein